MNQQTQGHLGSEAFELQTIGESASRDSSDGRPYTSARSDASEAISLLEGDPMRDTAATVADVRCGPLTQVWRTLSTQFYSNGTRLEIHRLPDGRPDVERLTSDLGTLLPGEISIQYQPQPTMTAENAGDGNRTLENESQDSQAVTRKDILLDKLKDVASAGFAVIRSCHSQDTRLEWTEELWDRGMDGVPNSTMSTYSFYQVDVFSDEATKGNPVAVVIVDNEPSDSSSGSADPSAGPSEEAMQSFASWTNLSETTFLFPNTAGSASGDDYDYTLRIFTPVRELPFAGHPTLGSCQAWLQHSSGKAGTGTSEAQGEDGEYRYVTQRCQIGNVTIRVHRQHGTLAFAAPPLIRSGPVDSELVDTVCDAMKVDSACVIDHYWVDTGPGFFALQLQSAKQVLEVNYETVTGVKNLIWGIFGEYEGNSDDPDAPRYEVRLFAPAIDVGEDPVTGSLNAGIAIWLGQRAEAEGRKPEDYIASQGTKVGRKGRVKVSYVLNDDGKVERIWIGGHANICIEGKLTL
ncbi:hypothetical protein BD324DRAFT_650040 [Kockovaella imperatae]|uniref:Phenazine biosynthesis protein n=1 Tax=Kockovaella imperatae TaxID=4999 RepID=A0A1Y1UNI8_9TREE|nr:hypothetical protein BD324DRAFT_650040 [Kockovaella imperatae]ORX38695.1 hypothetical protein BD324DRAFT_650040 [Kockovaella imperatae]